MVTDRFDDCQRIQLWNAVVDQYQFPRSAPEFACYLAVPVGALLGFPNPIGAAFGLLMAALLIKVVRLDMERFSKGLLIGIVIAGVFFVYLIFLLVFTFLFDLLEPLLQPLVGRTFKH